jgi:hypothetical protein
VKGQARAMFTVDDGSQGGTRRDRGYSHPFTHDICSRRATRSADRDRWDPHGGDGLCARPAVARGYRARCILWLQALRREGDEVGFWRFLKLGAVAMPLALGAALGARIILG